METWDSFDWGNGFDCGPDLNNSNQTAHELLLPSQLPRTSHLPPTPLFPSRIFSYLFSFGIFLLPSSLFPPFPVNTSFSLFPSPVVLNAGPFKGICFALSFEERRGQNAGPPVLGSTVGLCVGTLSLGWAGSQRGPSPWISSIGLLSHFAGVKSKTECSGSNLEIQSELGQLGIQINFRKDDVPAWPSLLGTHIVSLARHLLCIRTGVSRRPMHQSY